MGTIAACGGFGAVCGSSLATAATISKVAMPSMRRFGYHDSLSAGSIAAGGTLGITIPPSVPMVIYGLLSETDIATLFMAGILPGLLLIALFFGAIAFTTWHRPESGPRGVRVAWPERFRLLLRVWGVLLILVIIIGGIYAGIFTPTEAAGIGVAAAALFAWVRGKPGLITPPIGINAFVVKSSVPDVNIWTVLHGVLPFVAAMVLALLLVLAVPGIATLLPGLMGR